MFIRKPIAARKYFIPLTLGLLHITIYLASASVAYKLVSIGTFIEPGPPFIFPLTYAISDIASEIYGSSFSKLLVWLTLACELIFALCIKFVISLPSPEYWHLQISYSQVFGNIIWFVISGILAIVVSNFVNIYIIVKLKIITNGNYFWLRSITASTVGGMVMILIICSIAYYPVMGFSKTFDLFFVIFFFELLYSIILILPSWMICGILKKYENTDVFDYDVKFNPFIL